MVHKWVAMRIYTKNIGIVNNKYNPLRGYGTQSIFIYKALTLLLWNVSCGTAPKPNAVSFNNLGISALFKFIQHMTNLIRFTFT
jgi:hypothetical protein